MDPEFINQLPALGVGGILAVMFYFQNNKNAKGYSEETTRQAKDYADRVERISKDYADKIETVLNIERGRTEMLFTVVKDNTIQTTANTKVVEALHARLNGISREERQHGGA